MSPDLRAFGNKGELHKTFVQQDLVSIPPRDRKRLISLKAPNRVLFLRVILEREFPKKF